MGWIKSLDAVDTIRTIREQADSTKNETLDKAKKLLTQGKSAEEALEYLAHTLTNKLIHNPSANLKQAGYQGRQEIIKAAHELFEINDSDES